MPRRTAVPKKNASTGRFPKLPGDGRLVAATAHERTRRFQFVADKLLLRLDATIAAEIQAVTPLVSRITELVKETGCVAGKEFEVTLALHEALTNAVVHGARQDPNKMVRVTASCDRTRGILIVVRDPGTGFDLDSVPDPLMGERIFSAHGRGIFMINRLMDEVQYRRGGTEIHMRKK